MTSNGGNLSDPDFAKQYAAAWQKAQSNQTPTRTPPSQKTLDAHAALANQAFGTQGGIPAPQVTSKPINGSTVHAAPTGPSGMTSSAASARPLTKAQMPSEYNGVYIPVAYRDNPQAYLARPGVGSASTTSSSSGGSSNRQPVTREVSANETVAHQLNNVLASNSPLMQRANTIGLQTANSRGLLNSSIAAGESANSMIDRATPVAAADAQTHFQQGLANQQAQNSFEMAKLNDEIKQTQMSMENAFREGNMELANSLQRDLNAQMQSYDVFNRTLHQGFTQSNMGLANQFDVGKAGLLQDFSQDNMKLQSDLDIGRMGVVNQYDMDRMGVANQYDMNKMGQSTTANTQGKYLDSINQITNNAMVSINEIEVTPGMTQEEKDAMIANTVARRDADLSWARQLYSSMPTWDFSWINTQPGDMPSAPGIGV